MQNIFNPYAVNNNLDRINRQIDELTNLKNQMQNNQVGQTPINNYINTNPVKVDLECKFLQEGQKVEDIIIQNKTLFIDENNKKISIKELDGTISKEYEIVIPKTKEQLRIEELENSNIILERRLKEMEAVLNGYAKPIEPINKDKQSNDSNARNDESKSKKSSK